MKMKTTKYSIQVDPQSHEKLRLAAIYTGEKLGPLASRYVSTGADKDIAKKSKTAKP